MEDHPVSFESLLRHRAWVRRMARALVRDEHAAADLEQETWIAAMQQPPRSEGAVKGWFRRVLRNQRAQMLRREERVERRERKAAKPDGDEAADEIVMRAEAQRAVVNHVFELEEPYRSTMLLRYFEELSPVDTAARLGVTAATVRMREHRALKKLRTRMDTQFGSRRVWGVLLGALALPAAASAAAASTTSSSLGTTAMAVSSKKSLLAGVAVCALLLCGTLYVARDALFPGEPTRLDRAARNGSATESAALDGNATRGTAPEVPGPSAAATARLSGEVRFAATSAPAEGVPVELLGPDGMRRTATTAASGYFSFDLPDGGPYAVRARREGYATPRVQGLELLPDEHQHLDVLWLDAPVRVRVDVVDPQGAPVADARVEAFLARPRVGGQDWRGARPKPVVTRTTDAQGRARLDDLAPGRWTFRASHASFAPTGLADKPLLRGGVEVPITLALARGHALEGVVLDVEKKPLAGATVLALAPREATRSMTPSPRGALALEAVTDEKGRYRFEHLPRGGHAIALLPEGGLPSRFGVVEVPSVSRFDILLDGGKLFGRVTDEQGKPVEGAEVRGAFWRRHSPTYLTAHSDADGRYEIHVPIGAYLHPPARGQGDGRSRPVNFTARKEGYVLVPATGRRAWTSAFVLHGAAEEWNLTLRRAATVEGRVQSEAGPVAGAEVELQVWNGFRGLVTHQARTDAEGRYRIDGVEDGFARVLVRKEGFAQDPMPDRKTMPGARDPKIGRSGVTRLDARMERGVDLRGVVRTREGAAVAAVEVVSEVAPATTTATDGSFLLAGVPKGELTLRVRRDGRELLAQPVDTSDESIELVIEGARTVRGRVDPAAGAFVQVAPKQVVLEGSYEVASVWQSAPRQPVATDGAFEVVLPSAEDYLVRAVAPGFAPAVADAEEGVRLKLERGHVMRGVVVAADGSGPIAGARIEFSNDRLPPALGQKRDWSSSGFNSHPFEIVATTGADGRFEIPDLPAFTYRLRVSAPGTLWAQPTIRLPADEPLRVELATPGSIRGRVQYEDGTPVGDALVRAHHPQGGFQGSQAMSKPDGSFELSTSAGAVRLEVAQGWQAQVDVVPSMSSETFASGATDVVLTAKRGKGSITGRCVAYGDEAVPGAWLHVRPVGGGATFATRSDADGRFTITGLSVARVEVRVVANRSAGAPDRFGKPLVAEAASLNAGDQGVTIALQPARTLQGTVTGPDGEPLRGGVFVRAQRDAKGWHYNGGVKPDGTFSIGNLPAGTFTLTLHESNTGKTVPLTRATRVESGAQGIALAVQATGAVSGRVLDASGTPVPGAAVFALDAKREVLAHTQTDLQGRYRLGGLTAPSFQLESRHTKLGRAVVAKASAGGTRDLNLEPQPRIALRAVDSEGAPLRHAVLRLVHEEGRANGQASTDAEGRVASRALPPGRYEVKLVALGGKPLAKPRALGFVRSGDPETTLR
ncbi:MAG: sigma-70 family RNA polymerase sigma factor [Planctomycetota bacterium]